MILTRVVADGGRTAIDRALAEEVPIAIEVNGIGYAVLMATPADLEDLAVGFAVSERLAAAGAPVEVDVHDATTLGGQIVRLTLDAAGAETVAARVRHRTSESSCGLCGVETLEQAMRALPPVTATSAADDAAVFRALAALDGRQPLNAQTGAVHAAALCGADGAIRLVREDVGRHNAFDKLIGAMCRAGVGWNGGFALLTSRCSYELVEKAVLSGCPLLATISAPTALAVSRAQDAGLPLRVLVRRDAMLAT
ncbi:formate dehydrogenase accessory sulfurtransferase FdhD [uncultured Sphingomonas sp.]|uniref:formate dehydrogenase accessory sulfurtransferase FdhD n=1 Tax=uncultured Sphingomonas sp. TaxID=158754 RepID=UPI0025E1CEB1|nr:formate dehydrogenase accessory sulfurtransferase FdhD [uncultured Sphingomonas sp.]